MPTIILSFATEFALLSSGFFLLIGMLTGVWKYIQIHMSEDNKAHPYVDIAHRASLLYSAACISLAGLTVLSVWTTQINFYLVLSNAVFFFFAVFSYVLHGMLKDTKNQFAEPHHVGDYTLSPIIVSGFMVLLIVAEVGATTGLLYGAVLGFLEHI